MDINNRYDIDALGDFKIAKKNVYFLHKKVC